MLIPKEIDLLSYKTHLRVEFRDDRQKIFDPIRKKWYILQPEEFVRQLVLTHLSRTLNYPLKRIGVERQLIVDGLKKRFDIVVYNNNAHPLILIECKAPESNISEHVAMQIAQYNKTLQADFLWITNGSKNLYYKMDYNEKKTLPVRAMPNYIMSA